MSIDGIRSILDGIADTLSCPLVLDDERQRLIAHTGHDVTADGVRVASILARGATPEIRAWFEQWGIVGATEPVRTPADRARRIAPRWVVPLRHQGMLLGFVSVLDHGRLTREELAPIVDSTAAIAEALYVARRAEPRRSALLELLVLPHHSGPGDDVTTDAAAMYPHTGPIAVVAFAGRGADAGRGAVPELMASVRHACRAFPPHTTLYADLDGAVVVLVPLRGEAAIASAIRLAESVADGTTGMLNVAAGVSSADWDASSAARAYGESIRALRIALADPTANAISRWDRAGAFRALTLLPVAGPVDPIDPRVRTLLEHPPLARTVETFLDRAGDAAATARTLRIHRATLYQRLARVDELCALDVQRSGEDRLTAHVGLRLAALAADRRRGPERRARNDVE